MTEAGEHAVLIRGGRPLESEGARPTSILLAGGRITATGAEADAAAGRSARIVEADGLFVSPGFIDVQVNGGFGHDFTADPTSVWAVGARLAETGVTAFLPTIVSSPFEAIAAARATLGEGRPAGYAGATPLGLHLEGPFLSPERVGAHNPAHLRLPDRNAAADWSRDRGVLLATIAPELPGALDLVADLVARGVVVSAGHSNGGYDEGLAAIEHGVRYATHLFNAMSPLDHHEPGLAAALLMDERVTIGLIVDGVHVAPAIIELIRRLVDPGRISVVSDAIAAHAARPGVYVLADREIHVEAEGDMADGDDSEPSGLAARTVDGRLAGGLIGLPEAVRNFAAFSGCGPAEAVETVTSTPARLLGLQDRGSLAVGAAADVVLLSADLTVEATFVGGCRSPAWE